MINLQEQCPIFKKECLGEKCTAFRTRVRQVFKNNTTGKYYNTLMLKNSWDSMTELERNQIVREYEITRECVHYCQIINVEAGTDTDLGI